MSNNTSKSSKSSRSTDILSLNATLIAFISTAGLMFNSSPTALTVSLRPSLRSFTSCFTLVPELITALIFA